MKKKCTAKFHGKNRWVNVEEMTRDNSRPDGYSSTCKVCARKRKREWLTRVYAGDPSVQPLETLHNKAILNLQRRRKQNGIAYCLFQSAKDRARKKKWDFDLCVDDIVIPQLCPILGIKLETSVIIHKGTKHRPDNYPTIDRIDSSKGYTKDNIHIISWRANHLKSDGTVDELIKIGEFAKNYKLSSTY